MISRTKSHIFVGFAIAATLLSLNLAPSRRAFGAQDSTEPRREQLLNGLRILIWSQSSSPNVTIALRINSGAAFDLAGKEGTMALLGDQLFPDPETRDYFVDELGGSLQVVVDYDSLTIIMTGRATELERMLEILRTAVVSTPITDNSFSRLRDARLRMVRDTIGTPSSIANRAIANRLYGDYPYGRPVEGTPGSLMKIDRADLLLARERFVAPDNSTMVVIGGVQESRVLRASRQLLGSWRKSDKLAPSTFRLPDLPDARTLIIDTPGADTSELRLAVRSVSRSDRDFPAATLLAFVARERWMSDFPELSLRPFTVRNESYLLSGIFVMGALTTGSDTTKVIDAARKSLRSVVESPPTSAELERARSEAAAANNRGAGDHIRTADNWLDAETYKLANRDQLSLINKVTPADLQRVAGRLFRDAAFASVVVGNAALIKTDLERTGKVEVIFESPMTQPTRTPTPAGNP